MPANKENRSRKAPGVEWLRHEFALATHAGTSKSKQEEEIGAFFESYFAQLV